MRLASDNIDTILTLYTENIVGISTLSASPSLGRGGERAWMVPGTGMGSGLAGGLHSMSCRLYP